VGQARASLASHRRHRKVHADSRARQFLRFRLELRSSMPCARGLLNFVQSTYPQFCRGRERICRRKGSTSILPAARAQHGGWRTGTTGTIRPPASSRTANTEADPVASRGERYGPDASAHPAASSARTYLQALLLHRQNGVSMCLASRLRASSRSESTGYGKPETRQTLN